MTGAELRQIRQALGLTQAQLALKLGLHVVTVANYERGKHPIPYPVAIAVSTFRLERMPQDERTI